MGRIGNYEDILATLNPDQKIRAYHVAAALEKRHVNKNTPDIFMEQVKTGSAYMGSPRILDAVAIKPSWANPCITGYEIKVDRGDFLQDDKWREYLPYVNEFYFVAPKGIIKEEELPAEIGLLTFNPVSKFVRTVRKAAWRDVEKAIAFDLLYFIIMWRGDRNRHVRSNVEKIEQYLEGKITSHYLAGRLKSKLLDELEVANRKVTDYEYKYSRLERNSEELGQIRKMLLEANIGANWDSVSERVQMLLDSRGNSLDQGMKNEINKIVAAASTLKKAIGL